MCFTFVYRYWLDFLFYFCTKCSSYISFGGKGNFYIKKRNGGNLQNFSEEGGVAYHNLWFVGVLGHGASWSLATGREQGGSAGNWSRPALEAAWRMCMELVENHGKSYETYRNILGIHRKIIGNRRNILGHHRTIKCFSVF